MPAVAGSLPAVLVVQGQIGVPRALVLRVQEAGRGERGRQEDGVEPGVEELELQLAAQRVRDNRPVSDQITSVQPPGLMKMRMMRHQAHHTGHQGHQNNP